MEGIEEIEAKYYVDSTPHTSDFGFYYVIKEKPQKENNDILEQCTAKTKKGIRCKRKPKLGFGKCHLHLDDKEEK